MKTEACKIADKVATITREVLEIADLTSSYRSLTRDPEQCVAFHLGEKTIYLWAGLNILAGYIWN